MKIKILLSAVICTIFQITAFSQSSILTNKQYREFTSWVRDSVTRMYFANQGIPEFLVQKDASGKTLPKPLLNRNKPIDLKDESQAQLFEDLLHSKWESLNGNQTFNVSKLLYSYHHNGKEIKINIYPDTLCWVTGQQPLDTLPYVAYTNNEGKVFYCNRFGTIYDALAATYFWHPYFDNYPVVGVNEDQISAFNHWNSTCKESTKKIMSLLSSRFDCIEIKEISLSHWIITAKNYSDFANWVADSILMRLLGEQNDDYLIVQDKYGKEIDPPLLNWGKRSSLRSYISKDDDVIEVLVNFYNPGMKSFNKAKIKYEYSIWDFIRATSYESRYRGDFISRDIVMGFPNLKIEDSYKDTVIWGDIERIKLVDLDYNGAYAYYNWLQYYSHNLKFKNPVNFYLLPNRKEWEEIKKSNKVTSKTFKIQLPTKSILIN